MATVGISNPKSASNQGNTASVHIKSDGASSSAYCVSKRKEPTKPTMYLIVTFSRLEQKGLRTQAARWRETVGVSVRRQSEARRVWDDEYGNERGDGDGDEDEESELGAVYEADVEDDTIFDQHGDFRDQEAFEAYVEGYCPLWALAGEYGLDSLNIINVDDEIIHYEPGADDEYLRDGCYIFDANFEAAASEIWHFRRLVGPIPVGGTEDFDVRSQFISHTDEFESAHETGHPETCDCPACQLAEKVAGAAWWAEYLAKMTNDEFAAFVDDMQADGVSASELQAMMDEWFTEAADDPVTRSPEPDAYDDGWLKDDEWMVYGDDGVDPPSDSGDVQTRTTPSNGASAHEDVGDGESANPILDRRGFSDYIPDYTERFPEGWNPDDDHEHEDTTDEADWDSEDPWDDDRDTEDEEEDWEEDEEWTAQDEEDSLFDQHGDFRDEQAFASYFEGYEPHWADEPDDDDDNGTSIFEGDEPPF